MAKHRNDSNGNGLILYHHYYSYYSQKVAFALLEKKLKFKSHIVDLACGENLEPWFVQMNPEGQIPVLKDGVKVIPDSGRIIEYLEDNFSNGDTPRLMPGKGTPQYLRMKEVQEKLNGFNPPLLTFGSVIHPHLTVNPKLSTAEIKMRKYLFDSYPKIFARLLEMAADNSELKKLYDSKKSDREILNAKIMDEEEVKKALSEVDDILDAMEDELASHQQEKAGWWLCDEKFTVADIDLTMILLRLDVVGFFDRFFGKGQRPHLRSYYKRAQQREAFKKLMVDPSTGLMGLLCQNKCCQATMAAILGTATVVGLVAAVAVMYKRIK